jgi:hypothetical protein
MVSLGLGHGDRIAAYLTARLSVVVFVLPLASTAVTVSVAVPVAPAASVKTAR